MWLDKIRESMSSKKTSSSSNNVNLNFDKELPKLNFDYRLNLDLYIMDKLIIEIFTDLKNEGFIADYHT
jgi:hypothetical protein